MAAQSRKPPAELLEYLAPYQVLVCSTCKYAIQPAAISRHLKEIHRLYRSDREPYLRHAFTFQLADAAEVIKAPIEQFPVPLLPILNGMICGHDNCDYLCASIKRMKRHWVSSHGCAGRENEDWYPVPMQTFFRGNLLSYFTDPCLNSTNAACSSPTKRLTTAKVFLSTLCKERLYAVDLDTHDALLFQHFVMSTSTTIATDESTKEVWQKVVPPLAGRFDFLMHAILACAALHLVHLDHPNRSAILMKAITHFDAALPLYRSTLAKLQDESAEAILAFAQLLAVNSFALQDENEQLLLVRLHNVEDLPAWLYFARNGCEVLSEFWDHLEQGPLKSLIAAWEEPLVSISHDVKSKWSDYLLSLIPPPASANAWPQEVVQVYTNAATSLSHTFSIADALDAQFTSWHILFIWPMEVSTEFITLLSACHPGMLILVAHYCILLRQLETVWYFKGRAKDLLDTVKSHLGEEYHHCIALPMREVANLYT
ncbi:hypothetical protein Plec18170_006721 [Paecilomyces lecythidis]